MSDLEDGPEGVDLGITSQVAALLPSDLSSQIFSDEDTRQLMSWLVGASDSPPAAIGKLVNNMINKLAWVMAFMSTGMLSRIEKMNRWMGTAEMKLYDTKDIVDTDNDTLMKKYKLAISMYEGQLEFVRKFMIQNKDQLEESAEQVDKLKSLLLGLSPQTIESLITKLEKGEDIL